MKPGLDTLAITMRPGPILGSLRTGYGGLDIGVLAAPGGGCRPGWVTTLPLPRTAQLRALDNGVVPQLAVHAITLLLNDLHELLAAAPLAFKDAA
ncbi:hypothetical protein LWC34_45670 [Kibdelosporangium philippinense]|uniref:Uncharacterized protein n=1 Tax=Kibdelosporangium philippinense TaxID=211113 RepID=A0ABS8ZQQ0_9PSEU|nr:hypothetical protein [Kibdelosporangium philippinense]MCE7010049.1 hypothetical protein [Kibdelosporangium philippinense]